MMELLDGKYTPTTHEFGFLACAAKTAAEEFRQWQGDVVRPLDQSLTCKELRGELPALLKNLLPLTTIERRRYAFIPIDGHAWCAYFDNGQQGTDAGPVMSVLAERLGTRAVRCVSVDHRFSAANPTGELGATIFELYGPKPNPVLNTVRSVYAAHNGSKWEFGANGEVQGFEQLDAYSNRKICDRFNSTMLQEYMCAIGLKNIFDENLYNALKAPAFLVEKTGNPLPNSEIGLTQYL